MILMNIGVRKCLIFLRFNFREGFFSNFISSNRTNYDRRLDTDLVGNFVGLPWCPLRE